MSLQPSLRGRRASAQTLRQSQPTPWVNGLGSRVLTVNLSGSSVIASVTANAAGAWLQFISNTTVPASDAIHAIHIQSIGNNQAVGANNSMLLDIGRGAAGSEVIVAQNIAIGGLWNTSGAGPYLHIPVRIPGATRVAMRVRAAVGGRIMTASFFSASTHSLVNPSADRLPLSVDTLGSNQSTSEGTAMSGASGTWAEITSATTKDYQSLVVVPSGPANGSGLSTTQFRLDLGIGPAGQEVAVAYSGGFYNANGIIFPYPMQTLNSLYGGFVPAGTRIAVRHNLASNPQRVCACVIGVPYA